MWIINQGCGGAPGHVTFHINPLITSMQFMYHSMSRCKINPLSTVTLLEKLRLMQHILFLKCHSIIISQFNPPNTVAPHGVVKI